MPPRLLGLIGVGFPVLFLSTAVLQQKDLTGLSGSG